MRRAGLWQDEALDPRQLQFTRAFAGDTMAFQQWLQFVFVPRVREIVAARGPFPPRSQVAVQAVREFDGVDDASHLIALLAEFDFMFQG
jgi:uncharacterized protein YqcC (DUF446 family)